MKISIKTTQFLKMPATFVALGVLAFAMSTVSGAAPTATKGNRSYQSLSDAITATRYAVAESELGATAANTANNVRMSFTSDELQLKSIAQEKGWNLSGDSTAWATERTRPSSRRANCGRTAIAWNSSAADKT